MELLIFQGLGMTCDEYIVSRRELEVCVAVNGMQVGIGLSLILILSDNHWFAIKVFYNRLGEVEHQLSKRGIETFVPMTMSVVVRGDGRKQKVRKPLVNSLMFFNSSYETAVDVDRRLSGRAMVYCRPDPPRRPASIPPREMTVFKLVASAEDSELEYLGGDTERYSVGQLVRVTDGAFAGAEGRICRIKGDRRLVVTINGVCAVATAYIPSCFLKKIEG